MTLGTEKRCFVALPLDEALRADLVEATMVLRQVDGLRVAPPANWHITLKFLGGVFDSQIEDVIAGMRLAAEGVRRFAVDVRGVGCLPSARQARVLAAELDCPPLLSMLAEQMEDAMAAAGFQREGRAYRPHITLGRFKRPPRFRLPTIALPDSGMRAERIVLYESVLEREGPTYYDMASVELPEE